jgi:membrane associated rhomboid family serine protease
VIERGFVWQVFTYMWLHSPGGLAHILFNILGLFFFGGILEQRWGGRAFLRFYLLSGVIAGLVVLGVGWFFDPSAHTMGASGGVLGLLAGFGIAMGGTPILLFGILPLRARTLLWIALAWVLLDWFMRRTDVSVAAHLGGIAAGALLVTGWWRPSKLRAALSERLRGRARVRFERRNGGKPWLN